MTPYIAAHKLIKAHGGISANISIFADKASDMRLLLALQAAI